MTKSQQEGVFLVELMIVVAIIGIIAAFAIPTYFDYIKKAKVAEASVLFDGFKTKMSILYAMKGIYPTFDELKADGVVYRGTFVLGDYNDTAAAVGTPQVCFQVNGFEAGKDSIGWMYISDPLDPFTKVWSCRAADSICTTMENKYLPLHCRPFS